MIHIDGSLGEGGGQVLRTALVLSAVTGRSFHLVNIRGRRRKPGLASQHSHAVRVFRDLCGAESRGESQGSQELHFAPGRTKSGSYQVDIGTAGSTTLILQALAIALASVEETSEVVLRGGTHVPWSPPFNYIESCWLPLVSRVGLSLDVRLDRAGFYPKGGGLVSARIHGGASLRGLNMTERGALRSIHIVSAAARLPGHVRNRQAGRARAGVQAAGVRPSVHLVELEALSPGTVVAITGVFDETRTVASALGARGKPAETVGEEAATAFRFFLERTGAVDAFMADQLVLPLVLARGSSEFTTVRVTEHLKTNVAVIRSFLDRRIDVEGEIGTVGTVKIGP
jgi:RNA 3'-terminal phosphate cyclase (ATP)